MLLNLLVRRVAFVKILLGNAGIGDLRLQYGKCHLSFEHVAQAKYAGMTDG
jgi:hypothetical protein